MSLFGFLFDEKKLKGATTNPFVVTDIHNSLKHSPDCRGFVRLGIEGTATILVTTNNRMFGLIEDIGTVDRVHRIAVEAAKETGLAQIIPWMGSVVIVSSNDTVENLVDFLSLGIPVKEINRAVAEFDRIQETKLKNVQLQGAPPPEAATPHADTPRGLAGDGRKAITPPPHPHPSLVK